MLIGRDFDKIKINVFGFDFLEPNTFIGDLIIFVVAIYFAYKISKNQVKLKYFTYWKWFFIVFGVSFFTGGFGHLLYNYFGISGKYFSWYSGIISTCLLEIAFISIFPIPKWKILLMNISLSKMITAIFVETYFICHFDLHIDPSKGLTVPAINTIIGLGLTVGFLGAYYQQKIDKSFKYFWIGSVILLPSAFCQFMKINVAQWMDRNDASHIFLLASILLYYKGIEMYEKKLKSYFDLM